MIYEPTKEDVERAARTIAVAAFSPEEAWPRHADTANYILTAHHRALVERGVFVVRRELLVSLSEYLDCVDLQGTGPAPSKKAKRDFAKTVNELRAWLAREPKP